MTGVIDALRTALVALSLVSAQAEAQIPRPAPVSPPPEVVVTIVPGAEARTREVVNFGMPLPPSFLGDSRLVRVIDAAGAEIEAAVRPLEPWRIDGRDGSIRSLQVQFELAVEPNRDQRVRVVFGAPRTKDRAHFVPVAQTLVEPDGLKGPRVHAVLPARWLADSWIAGPQVPASDSGRYADYDRFVDRNFPHTLKYLTSETFDHWLFDRTTVYYKMYVRTGERRFLDAAYRAAHFVRTNTKMDGPDAGIFIPKGVDLKYVYPRAMHLHYLLTGDERARETGVIMARFCLDNWDPKYLVGREFWTERHTGYGLLGVVHGWELIGDRAYWDKAREYADALYRHQQQPPDGRPADGSFRRARTSPEGVFSGTASAWMTSILIDPLFHYWTLTGDPRIPGMVVRWCDFLDQHGIVPEGVQAFYMIRSPASDSGAPPSNRGPDMELHNMEMAYMFAMGTYFNRDAARAAVYRQRFDKLFAMAAATDHHKVKDHRALPGRQDEPSVRSFNWATQASSQLVFFMQEADRRERSEQ